jgi:hypothetical protein
MAELTTDPTDPRLGHGTDDTPGPQNVRPYRDTYIHTVCGTRTKMGYALAGTYARQPDFYGSTYCVFCSMHKPVSEFVWEKDGSVVGS